MRAVRFWKTAGVTAALAVAALGLLTLDLLAQRAEPIDGAQPSSSRAPVAAAPLPDSGTPEPGIVVHLAPLGSDDGTCADPLPIACGEQDNRSNSGYNSSHDAYSCVGWDETGPEVIYSFTLAPGSSYTVTAQISNLSADLDVFLLASDGCDAGTCLAWDSFHSDTAIAHEVGPGTYYIAVDGYQGALSSYTLDLTCDAGPPLNNPPYEPSSPSPKDGATGVGLYPDLSWTGGDPDIGDTLVYTIYGDLASSLTSDVWCTTTGRKPRCQPPQLLQSNTKYAWQVVASDGAATRQGTFWEFTTGARVYVPVITRKLDISAPRPETKPTPTPTATTPPTVIPPPSLQSVTRFVNRTPYVIVSLVLDGVEQYPASPLGLLPDTYLDLDLGVGNHTLNAYNGWWQDDGSRFTMYWWQAEFPQQAGAMTEVSFEGPAIELLLPDFGPSQYWEGEYWTGEIVTLHTAGFCFYDDGSFRFYLDGVQDDTGTYEELYRTPGLVTFRATNAAVTESFDGVLNELGGYFTMGNGPPDWRLIQYYPSAVACPAAP